MNTFVDLKLQISLKNAVCARNFRFNYDWPTHCYQVDTYIHTYSYKTPSI